MSQVRYKMFFTRIYNMFVKSRMSTPPQPCCQNNATDVEVVFHDIAKVASHQLEVKKLQFYVNFWNFSIAKVTG
jgi:hypothetical protein